MSQIPVSQAGGNWNKNNNAGIFCQADGNDRIDDVHPYTGSRTDHLSDYHTAASGTDYTTGPERNIGGTWSNPDNRTGLFHDVSRQSNYIGGGLIGSRI